jgi:hypothetical protein
MIYEFKSRVAGTVVMTEAVAEEVLRLIGKAPGAQGIIVPEHMPEALRLLREAAQQSRARPPTPEVSITQDDEAMSQRVSLAQRLVPFIELLERSHQAGREITWGV